MAQLYMLTVYRFTVAGHMHAECSDRSRGAEEGSEAPTLGILNLSLHGFRGSYIRNSKSAPAWIQRLLH